MHTARVAMSDLPIEVVEFEQLLRKPNSDPTGFAGYFNSGEIWVARVPARLDVIGGCIFTLLKEESIHLPYGFSMLLLSAVPMNVGIGSSAAVEIGTLSCLNAYLGLKLSGGRIAQLGQMAENHVVGAPCGIMDQT